MWFLEIHLWLHRGFWVSTAFSLWPGHYAGIVFGCSCSFRFLTCLIVTAGLQSFSSSRRDKHTVPDGYTLGWKIGGSNLPEKVKDTLFIKPSFPNHFTPKQFVIWYNNIVLLRVYIISVLTRILPWGVSGPSLLRNRGPVRTLGGQS